MREVPLSSALDELIVQMRDGEVPNLGRFCGYCRMPLVPHAASCPTLGTDVVELPPREKIQPKEGESR